MLEVTFLDDFVPQPDDVFPFLGVGDTLTGNFDDVILSGLPSGTTFDRVRSGRGVDDILECDRAVAIDVSVVVLRIIRRRIDPA